MNTHTHSPTAGPGRRDLSGFGVVAVCMVVTIMEGYNLILYGNVIPLLLDEPGLGLDEKGAGFIGGIVYLGGIVGVVVGTALADRISRRATMAVGAFTFAFGSCIVAMAGATEVLGLGRVVTGIGAGISVTTAMTLARNHAPKGRVNLALTITMAGIPLGGMLAALLGIILMPSWGWRPMFWLGAAMTLVTLAVLLAVRIVEPEEVQAKETGAVRKFAALFARRGWVMVALVALAAFANMVTWFGVNVWLTEAMRDLGFSMTLALTFIFTLTGASVVASFGIAAAADRFGSTRVGLFTSVVVLVALLGLLTSPSQLTLALVLVALLGVGGHSTQILINATASSVTGPHLRGTMLGVMNVMANVGSFLGPSLGGMAFAANGSTGVFSVYAVSAVVTIGLCVVLHLVRRARSGRTPGSTAARASLAA